jgi:hypothetical protein
MRENLNGKIEILLRQRRLAVASADLRQRIIARARQISQSKPSRTADKHAIGDDEKDFRRRKFP